ncbi:MAG TPA: FISUMP domain-containing protein [Fibrobacteria bacterium]|nr:FISUMP domain-containing protein [Fibrobacteria bacterium]
MFRSVLAARGIFVLALSLCLGACQSTTVVEDEAPKSTAPAGRFGVEFAFVPEIAPDSVSWTLGSAKGMVATKDLGEDSLKRRRLTVEVEYGTAQGDSLWLDLRRHGVRVSRIAWVRTSATEPFLLRAETIHRDTLGRLVLRKLHAAGLAGKAKADSVYASLLLAGVLDFDGFPDSVPGGMDVAAIRRIALVQAVARKVPLVQLADAWLLDLNAAQARDTIHAMIVGGLVAPADTAALYPPAPIRLTSPLALDSVARPGGAARALGGTLVCDDGLQLLQVKFLDDKGQDASGSFAPVVPRTPAGTQVRLDTTGIVVQASAGAMAGTYRLRLVVLDRKARFDSFELSFQVEVLQQAKAPRITWVSPAKDTVLTAKDSTWLVQIKVDDSLKLDSVVIAGKKADRVGAIWQVLDTIHAWGTPVSFVARAHNAAGRDTSSTSRTVTLNATVGDALPTVIPVDPADGSDTVPYATATRKVSWKFAPGASFKDVQAVLDRGDGAPKTLAATAKDSVWSTDVPLPATGKPNMVKVLVVTASGYVVPVDTFFLARKKDTVSPSINPQSPPAVVNFDSLTVTLRWKISDNHRMDTVKINGVRVVPQVLGSDTTYVYALKLDTGTNKARVLARDSSGNLAKDSVTVIRLHSSDPPKITRRTGTTDRSIEYRSTDSFTVAWNVTDKEKLDSVVIAGEKAKDSAGIFSRKVAIGPGVNRIGIQAWGKYSGKSAVDTVEITTVASDADLNKYNILLMPDGRVWMTSNLRVTGGSCGLWGCDLSGRTYTWSKAMGLDAAYDAKLAGTSATGVVRGLCPSGWHVAQAKEWSALYAATFVKGATDSALALRVDTGWGGTQGRNLWGNFLMANFLYPEISMITSGGTKIRRITNLVRSILWTPGEEDASTVEALYAGAAGTGKLGSAKTNTFGVRCIEDKRMIVRPIGTRSIDSLVITRPIGTRLDPIATRIEPVPLAAE